MQSELLAAADAAFEAQRHAQQVCGAVVTPAMAPG